MVRKEIKLNIKELYNEGQSDYTIYNWLVGSKDNWGMHYGFWDEKTANMDQAIKNENQYVMDKLGLKPEDKILDAGCGVGGPAIYLSKKHAVNITAITLAEEQVKRGLKYAEGNGVGSKICFMTMDYHKTDFKDDTFDKIYSIESADAANPVQDYIKEMLRISRPGGQLLILDAFLSKPLKEYEGVDRKHLDDLCNSWALPDPQTAEYWKKELLSHGFTRVESEDLTKKVLKTAKIIRKVAIIVKPIYFLLYHARIIPRARYANSVASLAQGYLFKKGLLEYHSILATK